MRLPNLVPIKARRDIISKFMGYDHRDVILDGKNKYGYGEWYDCHNLTSDKYPTAKVRAKRGAYLSGSSEIVVTGMCRVQDKLCYITGQKLVIGSNEYTWTKIVARNQHQMVVMGAYLIILPEWIYFNTADPNDKGDINQEINTGSTEITLTPCDSTGDTAGDPLNHIMFSCEGAILATDFSVGDTVGIHRYAEHAAELPEGIEGYHTITAIANDYFVFKGVIEEQTTIPAGTYGTNIMIDRAAPDVDYIIECGNRLWGCRFGKDLYNEEFVNEIYASALGDFRNWHTSEGGISTDAYTASVGTGGAFTGAIAYQGRPVFFKDNTMFTVYGSYPAQYQIQEKACEGAEKNPTADAGLQGSLAIVNNVLYYKSRTGIMAYDGSTPVNISAEFGAVTYTKAVGGGHLNKYYVCLKDGSDAWVTFVYDTQYRIWHKEDGFHFNYSCSAAGEMYFGTSAGIRTLNGSGAQESDPVEWYAESGDMGLDSPDRKYVSRLTVRMRLAVGTWVKIWVRYDGEEWEHQATLAGYDTLKTFSLPVRVKRCDHFRLKFEGCGDAQIYSITRTIEGGSDIGKL